MTDTDHHNGINRRAVMAGAAWTVPAVVLATTLPAYALSNTVTRVEVTDASRVVYFTRTVTVTFKTTDGSTVKAGTRAEITVNITQWHRVSWTPHGVANAVGCTIVSAAPSTLAETGSIVVVIQLTSDATSDSTTASFRVTNWLPTSRGNAVATGGTGAPNSGSVQAVGTVVPFEQSLWD